MSRIGPIVGTNVHNQEAIMRQQPVCSQHVRTETVRTPEDITDEEVGGSRKSLINRRVRPPWRLRSSGSRTPQWQG